MVGPQAMEVAAIVKMLQNVLIGIVAFCWALYWVTKVERVPGRRPSLKEVWIRFPKFILGFAGASVVFSFLLLPPRLGQVRLDEILKVTSTARGWLFALAFVTIGLDSRFADLKKAFKDQGPPSSCMWWGRHSIWC